MELGKYINSCLLDALWGGSLIPQRLFQHLKKQETQPWRPDLWTQWEEGEGAAIIESDTLPYVKQIACGILLFYAGSSGPELCDNVEEWDGMGGSRGRGHMHVYD